MSGAYNNFFNQMGLGIGSYQNQSQAQNSVPHSQSQPQVVHQHGSGSGPPPMPLDFDNQNHPKHSNSKSQPRVHNARNNQSRQSTQSVDTATHHHQSYDEKCPICLKEQFIILQNPELPNQSTLVEFIEKVTTCITSLQGTKRLCNDPICHSYGRINKLCTVIEKLEKALADLNDHIKGQFLPFEEHEENPLETVPALVDNNGSELPEIYYSNDDSNTGDGEYNTNMELSHKKPTRNSVKGRQSSFAGTSRRRVTNSNCTKLTSSPITNIMKDGGFTEIQLQSLSNGPPFFCPETKCGKSFKQKHYLASHLLVHTQEKPFVCPKCGKAFRHNPALFLHIRRHDGIRAYACAENGCTFRGVTKWALTQHMKSIHIRIKDLLCSYCPKTFTCSNNLRVHQRFNHPEKVNAMSYSCEHCPKTFKTKKRYNDHQINIHHTHEKKFICDECGKTFLEDQGVIRHKKEVHLKQRKPLEKKYKCQEPNCGKAFYRKLDLERHTGMHVKQTMKAAKELETSMLSDSEPKAKRKHRPKAKKSKQREKSSDSESDKDADIPEVNKDEVDSSGQTTSNILHSKREQLHKRNARVKRATRNRSKSNSKLSSSVLSNEESIAIISSIMLGSAKEIQVKLERLDFKQEEYFIMKEEIEPLELDYGVE